MQAGLNLLDNKIHLFFCDTRNVKVDEDFIDCCKGSFPPNEYADIMKFHFDSDKRMSMASRFFVREAVSTTGEDFHCANILRKECGGKPIWIPENPNNFFHLSVSHDSERVLMGSSKFLIGVDVMSTSIRNNRPSHQFFQSFQNTFNNQEWAFIYTASDIDEQIRRFMSLWCMKESYVKAIGTGLYTDPSRIECVPPEACDNDSTENILKSESWKLLLDGVEQSCKFFFFSFPKDLPDALTSLQEETMKDSVACVCIGPESLAHEIYGKKICSHKRTEIEDNWKLVSKSDFVLHPSIDLNRFIEQTLYVS